MVAMVDTLDDGKPAVTDEEILKEAAERFMACKDWQGVSDERSREDIKFANGDPRNAWQWPTKIYQSRTDSNDMPCLTINNTRVHNDLIINAMSKNRYGIKIRPTGGKASYKSAEVMQNIIRRIEYVSKASAQYRKVSEQQVDGGIGYILIDTGYVSERSFDQEIYLRASQDPTGVYIDRWCKEPDGSDANFGFVFDQMPRKEFNRKYPKWKDQVGTAPLDSMFEAWLTDKEVTVLKYYRKKLTDDTLVSYKTADGEEIEKLASEIKDEAGKLLYKGLIQDIKDGKVDGKTRKVQNAKVEWFLIAGDQIIEDGEWAGKYIPICRCPGREVVIDGMLDRKGHTRPLIDAQRMLNYSASTDVQVNALQPKAPWLASSRAVEGQEQWKTANVDNFGVLIYNDVDDEATGELQKIEAPQRIDPPRGNPGYQMAMQNAERQMMMISGQFQAQMGENDTQSAASGKAIGERQQQGDTATYHFPEHQGDMLRYIGVQLIDLIPKIYDTRRTLHILDDDGDKHWILIDPDQDEAVKELEKEKEDEEAIKLVFNPAIGEYECISDPGPDYATQRQEAWEAYTLILQQNMQLAGVIGDLIFRNGDFPGADKIAERLEKEIKAQKPYLFGGAEPQMMALQQQNQRLTAMGTELMQKLALKDIALKGKSEMRDIEADRAQTDRMKVTLDFLTKVMLQPNQQQELEHELIKASHSTAMQMIVDANAADVQQQANPQEPANAS